MMSDNRIGQSNRNHPFDAGPNSRVDLVLKSESPLVQQLLLHQQLKEEIVQNSNGRVRYIDSELYLRNKPRSPASGGTERQSGGAGYNLENAPLEPRQINTDSPTTCASSKRDNDRPERIAATLEGTDSNESGIRPQQQLQGMINKNCQVCFAREVRQELMNSNKVVQEINEQISKLKAQCLRSYFERQMMD